MSGEASWVEVALDRAERALAKAGVACWEIAADEVHSSGAESMDGEVEVEESAFERSIGIRILDGGIGFAGLSEPGDDDLADAIDRARGEAKRARRASIERFASAGPGDAPAGTPFLDPRATGRATRPLADLALDLEARALAVDPRVARIRPARIEEQRGFFGIRTSSGLDRREAFSRASAVVGVIAEDDEGGAHAAYDSATTLGFESLELGPIAERAATTAVRLLGAGSFRTARVPVIFGFDATAELMALLAGALDADRIERGASFLASSLGLAIASPELSLADAPHDPILEGCAWLDGEGLATSAKTFVDRGIMAAILDDLETAARAGRTPNAQATRGGARSRPSPGFHNLSVAPGSRSLEALYTAAEGGLYVHELSGTHTMNDVTGEISLGATGWAIRGGALAEPIEGVTVAGTLVSMLGRTVGLSAETRDLGAFRVPALLIGDVQVSA